MLWIYNDSIPSGIYQIDKTNTTVLRSSCEGDFLNHSK